MELGEGELLRGILHGFAAAYDALRTAAPAPTDPALDGLTVAGQVPPGPPAFATGRPALVG